jgi:hypothetical protein
VRPEVVPELAERGPSDLIVLIVVGRNERRRKIGDVRGGTG